MKKNSKQKKQVFSLVNFLAMSLFLFLAFPYIFFHDVNREVNKINKKIKRNKSYKSFHLKWPKAFGLNIGHAGEIMKPSVHKFPLLFWRFMIKLCWKEGSLGPLLEIMKQVKNKLFKLAL